MLKEYFEEFMQAVKAKDKEKAESLFRQTDSLWLFHFKNIDLDILNSPNIIDKLIEHDFAGKDEGKQLQDILKECKRNTQFASEFLMFLNFVLEIRFEKDNSYKLFQNLRNAIYRIVDNANVNITRHDVEFMSAKPLTKQSVLGKEKKSGKKYPNIPTSLLRPMDVDYYSQDSAHHVPYLTTDQKKLLKVKLGSDQSLLKNGKKLPSGNYLYALSPKGGLYLGRPDIDKLPGITIDDSSFHHSSFRAGQPVLSAGYIRIGDRGQITRIDSMSGHYKPPLKQFLLAVLILKEQNMINDNCELRFIGEKGIPKLGVILNDEKYAEVIKECREILQGQKVAEQDKVKVEQETTAVVDPDKVKEEKEAKARADQAARMKAAQEAPKVDVIAVSRDKNESDKENIKIVENTPQTRVADARRKFEAIQAVPPTQVIKKDVQIPKYVQKVKQQQDARAKAEQDARAKAEQDAKVKAEQDAKVKAEQDAKVKAEQDAKVKAEQDAKIKAELDTKAMEENARKTNEAQKHQLAIRLVKSGLHSLNIQHKYAHANAPKKYFFSGFNVFQHKDRPKQIKELQDTINKASELLDKQPPNEKEAFALIDSTLKKLNGEMEKEQKAGSRKLGESNFEKVLKDIGTEVILMKKSLGLIEEGRTVSFSQKK